MEIPKDITAQLSKIQNAEAIILTGSRAIGKESVNADWDFFVVLKKGSERWRKTSKIGNTWLEVFCNDENQIRKEFKEDLDEGRGVTTAMFVSGIIIKDNQQQIAKKLISEAKKLWQKGPRLSAHAKQWIDYNITTYIQDIEDCIADNNPALLLINDAVSAFVTYYYNLNQIWFPRPKDRLVDLSKRSKDLFNFVEKINQTTDWRAKAELVINMGQWVGKRFSLTLSGEEYTPPKKVSKAK